MVADVNLLQDMEEIVVVDVDQVVDQAALLIQDLVEITVVYGLFFSLSSVADAAETHLAETDVVEMTAVYGSFSFSSSVADAAETHLAETIIADATIAAANKRNFEDGSGRPFCMQS